MKVYLPPKPLTIITKCSGKLSLSDLASASQTSTPPDTDSVSTTTFFIIVILFFVFFSFIDIITDTLEHSTRLTNSPNELRSHLHPPNSNLPTSPYSLRFVPWNPTPIWNPGHREPEVIMSRPRTKILMGDDSDQTSNSQS